MKILVTGSTGYIGHQLVSKLAATGNELHLLVRDTNSPYLLRGKNIHPFKGDISEASTIWPAIQHCTQVYHCAAIARLGLKNRSRFFDINVSGTRNILEAALKAGVQKLVFTSSAGVYGSSFNNTITEEGSRPTPFETDYDLSKHMAEKEVKDFAARGLHATIVNPSRVYGPGPATYSNGVTRMIDLLMKKKWIAFPNLDQYYSNYSFINDVVKGHIGAMEKGNPGENYILGGENISYSQFQFLLMKNALRKNHILKIPIVLFKFLASVMEKMNSKAELSPALVDRLAKNRMLSSEKAIANLGYQVTPFENGLKATINYLISCNPQT